MNALTVRALSREDIPFVARVEHAVFSDAWSEAAILSHLEGKGAFATVITEQDTPIGYLLGTRLPASEGFPAEGELYRIAVAPDKRRGGAGARLLSHFLSHLEVCYLEVRKSNTAARALYERAGFLPCGERRAYYKAPVEDACLYRFSRTNED